MLLLLKVACVLTAATQTTLAAVVPEKVFWPTDPSLTAHFTAVYQSNNDNSAEVATTLGPANSADIIRAQPNSVEVIGTPQPNSAEVIGTPQPNSAEVIGTPQPNSAEVIGTPQPNSAEVIGTQQPNSAEVIGTQPLNIAEVGVSSTTLAPFTSSDVTPKPIGTNPSIASNQEIIGSNANSETSNNNEKGGASSVVGTQPFYPQGTNAEQVQGGSISAQPDNTVKVNTTAGTQPFYPQAIKIKQTIKGSHQVKPNTADIIGSVAGTQTFFPQTISVESEQGSGRKPSRPVSTAEGNNVAGIEPLFQPATDELKPVIPNKPDVTTLIGLEPIFPETSHTNSVPNSLRHALAEAGVHNADDDPLVENAKQNFISIWNIEAYNLGAPYLEVTDVWPEVGMVYMPTINQMSSKIQGSKPVKEAAERLATIWEERKTTEEAPSTNALDIFSVLADYLSTWGFGTSVPSNRNPVENDKVEGNEQLRIKTPTLPIIQPVAIIPPKIKPISGKKPIVGNHPANHRPAEPLPTPVHRPAIRLNSNSGSVESQEQTTFMFDPLPLHQLHQK